MKYLFVIAYFIIETHSEPCPEKIFGCLVYHCQKTDTTLVEVITTDQNRVNEVVKNYPGAKVDTFLLTKINN